jgi:adenine/guanine phosphoribosyltransferase-like PRPP-binding protein
MNQQGDYYNAENMTADKLKELYAEVQVFLKNAPAFEFVAFTGMSGAVFAPIVALAAGKPLIGIRKATDIDSHATRDGNDDGVCGWSSPGPYLIADDLVSTGATWKRIVREVYRVEPRAYPIGVLKAKQATGPLTNPNAHQMKAYLESLKPNPKESVE